MRTASRILAFSVSAVMLSSVFLGGTAHAQDAATSPAAATPTVSCSDNLNWDGCSDVSSTR